MNARQMQSTMTHYNQRRFNESLMEGVFPEPQNVKQSAPKQIKHFREGSEYIGYKKGKFDRGREMKHSSQPKIRLPNKLNFEQSPGSEYFDTTLDAGNTERQKSTLSTIKKRAMNPK